MKASDLMLRCLEEQGVTTIFGVPGEENADLLLSLKSSAIQFISCRHEQSAAFMADMHGRLTGEPGVCLATLGPGATNLATGVANANMDHVPLLAIIGQAHTNRLHQDSHQNMDAIALYKPITKWATSIREAAVIPEVVAKAFKIATYPKPGAVLIELPEDIAKQETELKPLPSINKTCATGLETGYITDALQLIAAAQAPLMLVGLGAAYASCDPNIESFMDQTRIYGVTTFMGKGALSDAHPQSLYTVGLGNYDRALQAFHQADLVIAIGYDMVEWHPVHWHPHQDKKIIHIDTHPAEVDQHYIPDVELIGNIQATLNQLNKQLNSQHQKDANLFQALRKRLTADLHVHAKDTHFPIKPQKNLADIRALLRADDILISDVGAHKMWAARQYPAYQSKTCLIYNGFCSMGGAMPGAVAAKRLYPQKNVVVLCGDGGFMMSIQALVTAVDLQLPFVVVVWQDNAYGLIQWKQEIAYQQSAYSELNNPDLAAVAQSLGCYAAPVNSAAEFSKQLEVALQNKNKPTVLVVPIDYSENIKLTNQLGDIVSH